LSKVKLDVLKPWVSEAITKILGFEDEIVIDLVFNVRPLPPLFSRNPGCIPNADTQLITTPFLARGHRNTLRPILFKHN